MKAVGKRQGQATLASRLRARRARADSGRRGRSAHACGNQTVTLEIENEPGKPKRIQNRGQADQHQGGACTTAFKFISALYTTKTTKTPESYKCTVAKFKVPVGNVPERCTKPGKKIQFAGQGG